MDPAPPHAFALRLGNGLALRLRERHHVDAAYAALDRERAHLSTVFGWAAGVTRDGVDAMVRAGLEQFARDDGFQADLCASGRVVGWFGVQDLGRPGGSAEVGFWLARAHQGQGHVTRALRALHRYLFEARGLGRVALLAPVGHRASERVAERLGYEHEAVRRRAYQGPAGLLDVTTYGLLREDWSPPPSPAPLPRFALYVDDDLALAPFVADDVPALHALIVAERDHLAPWMGWAVAPSLAATTEFVARRAMPSLVAGRGFEAGIHWRGRLVGSIGLHGVLTSPRRGMLGYWLAADAQGHGLVTRAVRALVAKAFDDLGFERLELRAQPGNVRSRRVAERLGFAFEGVERRAERIDGVWVDHAVYGAWPGMH